MKGGGGEGMKEKTEWRLDRSGRRELQKGKRKLCKKKGEKSKERGLVLERRVGFSLPLSRYC